MSADPYDDPYYIPPDYIDLAEPERLVHGRRAIRRMAVCTLASGTCHTVILILSTRAVERILSALLLMMIAFGFIAGMSSGRRFARVGFVLLTAIYLLTQIDRLWIIPMAFSRGEPQWAAIYAVALAGYTAAGLMACFSSSVTDLIDYRLEARDLGHAPPD